MYLKWWRVNQQGTLSHCPEFSWQTDIVATQMCLCRGKAVSMGTLALELVVKEAPLMVVEPCTAGTICGPQFPQLHMYAPFVHDGASFGGYEPHFIAQGSATAETAGVLLAIVLLALYAVQ
jgi:hypothetical protein